MRDDVIDNIGLGRGSKAKDGRGSGFLMSLDKARDVQVVGPEVMAPFGQAMGFVKHPSPNFPVFESIGKRGTAELLGGNKNQADIAQAQLVEHVMTLQRRE